MKTSITHYFVYEYGQARSLIKGAPHLRTTKQGNRSLALPCLATIW
ncbi:hypothetical protein [Phaeodactylibacter xiamenensis]